jgi:hypothetical protein
MIRGLLTEAATQVKRAASRICRGNAGEGGLDAPFACPT